MNQNLMTQLMDRAARMAWRGHGAVEPGCMVGAVVADAGGTVLSEGRYVRFGGPHAEKQALAEAGEAARGGTLLVTLEPCNHHGKTPPCTSAVIESGVGRVVHACHDPNPLASGGTSALEKAGIEVIHHPTRMTELLNAPHVHRTRTGLPWMVAKWAQTLDGRIATRNGASKWISSERSRRLVHRERGRVDAVLTGIGTVLADDPMLTARDLHKSRRTAERVVIDDQLQTPPTAQLITSSRRVPTTICCRERLIESPLADCLRSAGARVVPIPSSGGLRALIHQEAADRNWSTVLVESGGGLLGRLFREDLVNAALVFTSPRILGDESASGPVRGFSPETIQEGVPLVPMFVRQRKDDLISGYLVGKAAD
ncbi:MAG: bifunctional diaminohydroxyphosphoribosylaminopyrimidine deaminase/5-amino-6-(5-phosphoribosylamino)uracil reductase RibD [Planctomycetota bacterium]|nr:bifunctional diaminohydroxyphosphoribosylaminopyrimidine deaminase/5-amino-6-(5-phosphoribosylamino)uracil reductase RibD [Planctomycetota bacterium]